MRAVKIGLGSLNPTVGAFRSNTDRLLVMLRQMNEAGCTLACFAEQVIGGYPSEDLVLWDGYVRGQWSQLERVAAATRELRYGGVVTLGLSVLHEHNVYNVAAVIHRGEIVGIVPKELLPTYGVFYEGRTFAAGTAGMQSEINGVPFGDQIFQFAFGTLAVEICEDLWSTEGPLKRRAQAGAELVVNGSASPWRMGVVETRRKMIAERALTNRVALVYVNQVGGNDSLVCDGGGYVNQGGRMLLEAPRWREGFATCVVDLDQLGRREEPRLGCVQLVDRMDSEFAVVTARPDPEVMLEPLSMFDELVEAMITGLAGYFEKSRAFDRIGIALSGGRDSVLSLIVAWLYAQRRFANWPEADRRAAVTDFIQCFSLPTRYNSAATKSIARMICQELGVGFRELPIEDAFEREVEAATRMLPDGQALDRLTLQNIQARIRGMRMWNWSNSARGLWLQTGNMSEKAVGYTTIGGDLMGGYALLGNLPKTVVNGLLAQLHAKYGWASLARLLETAASAELAEDQQDERDLMPFAVLDECFNLFAGNKLMPEQMLERLRAKFSDDELRKLHPAYQPGMLAQWVERFLALFLRSIYKWVQAPQSVHLFPLELDRERALQLPVVQSAEWLKRENRGDRERRP